MIDDLKSKGNTFSGKLPTDFNYPRVKKGNLLLFHFLIFLDDKKDEKGKFGFYFLSLSN